MTALTTIDFHGSNLIAIPGDRPETALVAMKPVVEGMGLDWEAQRKKINAHPVLKAAPSTQTVQLSGDSQAREYLFMPLSRLNFWLATVNPKNIKNEITRAKVIEYQTECADVLFNHFFGKAIASGTNLTAQQVGGIVKSGLGKMHREIMAEIRAELKNELTPILQNVRITHQAGASAVTDKTAKEWLDEYGCVQKGRGKVVLKVSNALRAFAIKTGTPLLRCARTGTWLFPYTIAIPFMEGQGKAIIRMHNDFIQLGQRPIPMDKAAKGGSVSSPFAKKPETEPA
ncbi:phage antirepressor N-terminal domain-containing protein [Komagataeibacter europaeus]|uniref:phage antirepressor N-terminal domain-containing protein n=1 Tax=Komagataeibacter europaeus TaxID=33995 RepID=UPI000237E092|nr:phage antirepressor N-terminal domain-containing protein [Komagataeibacter europaeus]